MASTNVQVFNFVLTPKEVAQLHNTLRGRKTKPVGLFRRLWRKLIKFIKGA